MPNELKFEVEIKRQDIQDILSDSSVTYIVVSGAYTYQGGGNWNMIAVAEGYDANNNRSSIPPKQTCPRPCP